MASAVPPAAEEPSETVPAFSIGKRRTKKRKASTTKLGRSSGAFLEGHRWKTQRTDRGNSIRSTHARLMLVRLQEEIYARRWAAASSIIGSLMAEFNHYTAAIVQAGLAVLDSEEMVPGAASHRLRFLRRMSRLDYRHRKALHLSTACEAARQGALGEAREGLVSGRRAFPTRAPPAPRPSLPHARLGQAEAAAG